MIARTLIVALLISAAPAFAVETRIAFDLPSSIECRDVTPKEFAAAHPALKVIEAKFRISARVIDGNASDIIDFLYVLESTHKSLRVQDYLPNTTLESSVVEDHIEITDATESSKASGTDAHVVYKPFALGGSLNQSSKKSESSHYKQIASKDLVLASGTTNREHGVFFRLRPSRAASFEGAKEFTLLATVPKTWRGDLCAISCDARATKRSLISTSVGSAGTEQAQIGMYLACDAEAAALAEELRRAHETYATILKTLPTKECALETISNQAAGLFTGKKPEPQVRKELADAEKAMVDVQERLKELAK
jgi:hypothetical protein